MGESKIALLCGIVATDYQGIENNSIKNTFFSASPGREGGKDDPFFLQRRDWSLRGRGLFFHVQSLNCV